MHILLTGANGVYWPAAAAVAAGSGAPGDVSGARPATFPRAHAAPRKTSRWCQGDLRQADSLPELAADIDAAYYLVHSMSTNGKDFFKAEQESATNFVGMLTATHCRQIIYLSGLVHEEAGELSEHLRSRQAVEEVLRTASEAALTVLQASIVIGSGSASFEIIRDLTEKLPVMVTPRWLNSRCQPIGVRDVMFYLTTVLDNTVCFNQTLEIGGPDVLRYKDMLLMLAEERGLKRRIITLPLLTPRLSSWWLYLVTSTSFSLARSLVDSLKHDTVVDPARSIQRLIPHECMSYREAVQLAFQRIEQNEVVSRWTDTLSGSRLPARYLDMVQVPQHGVVRDQQARSFTRDPEAVLDNIWRIGGQRGWYKTDWLWRLRGWLDRLVGGVGLRRGRRSATDLRPGDPVDFWRVLVADRAARRLLLYAEMRLPGDAWLQFEICPDEKKSGAWCLRPTASFRPKGLAGRLYWYAMLPFHYVIFRGMIENLVHYGEKPGTPAPELPKL